MTLSPEDISGLLDYVIVPLAISLGGAVIYAMWIALRTAFRHIGMKRIDYIKTETESDGSALTEGYVRKGGQNPPPQNFTRPDPPPAFKSNCR